MNVCGNPDCRDPDCSGLGGGRCEHQLADEARDRHGDTETFVK